MRKKEREVSPWMERWFMWILTAVCFLSWFVWTIWGWKG